ncbi:MAG: TetR/AcrR family transcriptional regulator [Streptosporangiaceae bacterium]
MPKLWTDTIEEHRQAVHDAALDTVAALVREHGLASVTMSRIAAEAGIGRATLYKYFPDVEAVLAAWHEREITRHLAELAAARDAAGPDAQLDAVLSAWALIQHQHSGHDAELATLLHQGEHVIRARQHLHDLVADLIADGAAAGQIRDDAGPGELASYCLHALTAASAMPSPAAVGRLVAVTLDGLRPAE